MRLLYRFFLIFLFFLVNISVPAQLKVGADRMDKILPLVKGKRVGLIVNHTSLLSGSGVHLLDTLVARNVDVKIIFAPEHGFRGNADAGELVKDGKDSKTGIPIVSLYGQNKKPSAAQVKDLDLLIFDIQDVGTRFYTYISTMFYAMQTCVEEGKTMIVLDRPNPNDYIDGPIIRDNLKSFVGVLSIPVLHGLTVGELALMIRGEKWAGQGDCSLVVVPMTGWKHGDSYSLPVKPSPNLPNDQAVKLYPSLCFFEATQVSVGRGTLYPFQVIGYPDSSMGKFSFTPKSLPGFDKNPLQKGNLCYGTDLRTANVKGGMSLSYFLDFYKKSGKKAAFISRPDFFDLLMGDSQVRVDIIAGKSESQIRQRWQKELQSYKAMRLHYLLYTDKK